MTSQKLLERAVDCYNDDDTQMADAFAITALWLETQTKSGELDREVMAELSQWIREEKRGKYHGKDALPVVCRSCFFPFYPAINKLPPQFYCVQCV